jgi:hypothetical protein
MSNLKNSDWYVIWIRRCSLLYGPSLLGSRSGAASCECLEVGSPTGSGNDGDILHPLCNHERLCGSAGCSDVTQHRALKANLRVAIRLAETFGNIAVFERKLRLPELQVRSGCDSLLNSESRNVH